MKIFVSSCGHKGLGFLKTGGLLSLMLFVLFPSFVLAGTQQVPGIVPNIETQHSQEKVNCIHADAPFPFADAQYNWARPSIEYLYRRCAIDGKRARQFAPNDHVTRAEAVKVVVKLFGFAVGDYKNIFADVGEDDWFAPYVLTGVHEGLLSGYQLDERMEFRPQQDVTRVEALKMLLIANEVQLGDGKVTFTDVHEDDWFYPYVAYAASEGIVQGYGKGDKKFFAPNEPVTRAEFSKMAVAVFDRGFVPEQKVLGVKTVREPTETSDSMILFWGSLLFMSAGAVLFARRRLYRDEKKKS